MTDSKKVMLRSVRTRAAKLADNTEAFNRAIYGAHTEGASYREIAEAAGISHTQAKRIVDAETADRAASR